MRKKRWAALLAAACLLAGLLCGCGAAGSGAQGTEAGGTASGAASSAALEPVIAFTDDLGRELTVDRPQRAAVLIGSFADIWCSAGGKDVLAATAGDAWTQFDLGLGEDVVDLGSVKSPSAEALLACEPDFVLASTNTAADLELQPVLEAAGIPVAYFGVSSFEDYLRLLDICTKLTGRPELFETYGAAVREQVEDARETAARLAGDTPPRALYLRASSSSVVVKGSEGNVLGEMLADLDCVNIADSDTSLLENLSMEAILAADPDKIFFVLQGDAEKAAASLDSVLLANPAWQQLTAVQSGEYYYMDPNLYNLKPNARWGEAYEDLVEILYGTE